MARGGCHRVPTPRPRGEPVPAIAGLEPLRHHRICREARERNLWRRRLRGAAVLPAHALQPGARPVRLVRAVRAPVWRLPPHPRRARRVVLQGRFRRGGDDARDAQVSSGARRCACGCLLLRGHRRVPGAHQRDGHGQPDYLGPRRRDHHALLRDGASAAVGRRVVVARSRGRRRRFLITGAAARAEREEERASTHYGRGAAGAAAAVPRGRRCVVVIVVADVDAGAGDAAGDEHAAATAAASVTLPRHHLRRAVPRGALQDQHVRWRVGPDRHASTPSEAVTTSSRPFREAACGLSALPEGAGLGDAEWQQHSARRLGVCLAGVQRTRRLHEGHLVLRPDR
mmetsp:Transcript_2240/g.8115  ORF Transcript_2240/g.8115 Transcript_2240/m.8115 type:complete len:342 (-) Transcript_2240:1568-2593(-)